MVVKGLVVPFVAAVELEKEPVINGISCVTCTSASSLFMVTSDGVEMMLLLPSLRNAWMSAAKPLPVVELYVPRANVAPVPTVALLMPLATPVVPVVLAVAMAVWFKVLLVAPMAAAARSTMLVPWPGRLITP